jgi:hypothetical protein
MGYWTRDGGEFIAGQVVVEFKSQFGEEPSGWLDENLLLQTACIRDLNSIDGRGLVQRRSHRSFLCNNIINVLLRRLRAIRGIPQT